MLSPKQAAQPNPSLSRPMSSRHHISMEHRLRRKHLWLNCDTDASNEMCLKERQEKSKKNKTFCKSNLHKWKSELPQQELFDDFFWFWRFGSTKKKTKKKEKTKRTNKVGKTKRKVEKVEKIKKEKKKTN